MVSREPTAFTVLVNLAAMGKLGIPLGAATSMFFAITVTNGVGVRRGVRDRLPACVSTRDRQVPVTSPLPS